MAQTHKDRKTDKPQNHETAGAYDASRRAAPMSIDLDDLQEARRDARLRALLSEAQQEGKVVHRDGRQRW
jgi:hypothetical protein